MKRIKIYDYFKILDKNKDGFIDINEFSNGLKEIVDFSIPIIEGMFSYLDNMKIGLVDQPRFI